MTPAAQAFRTIVKGPCRQSWNFYASFVHIFIQQIGLCAIRESLCWMRPHRVAADHWSNKLLALQKQGKQGSYGGQRRGQRGWGERVNTIELNINIWLLSKDITSLINISTLGNDVYNRSCLNLGNCHLLFLNQRQLFKVLWLFASKQ